MAIFNGCANNINANLQPIVKQLKIGMHLEDVQIISKKYTGEQLDEFFIHHNELIDICKDESQICIPNNLHKLVKIKNNGDITVITPAIGLFKHKRLSVSEYVGVFYNKKSRKVIGWVYFRAG